MNFGSFIAIIVLFIIALAGIENNSAVGILFAFVSLLGMFYFLLSPFEDEIKPKPEWESEFK